MAEHMRKITIAASAALAFLSFGAVAQDSLGGFDQPYTNAGNLFGKGYWGPDGNGLAVQPPQTCAGNCGGFVYGQPYQSSSLFGSGFWANEFAARQIEVQSYPGHDGHDEHGYGKHGYDKHGHGKCHKGKACGGEPKVIVKERTRFVPFAVERTVIRSRSRASIVVIERKRDELGRLNVQSVARTTSGFSAICLDGKGDEHGAIRATPDDPFASGFSGEVFRCRGHQSLRVSYPTGALEAQPAVATADGSSYTDCEAGEAFARTGDGRFACVPKIRMTKAAEEGLARRYGEVAMPGVSPEDEAALAEAEGRAPSHPVEAVPVSVDLSNMEFTGGVGGH